MSNNPLFSIIIPTYNRASFIKKAVDSILGQDFKDFEIIVVDDGSSDNTHDVISKIIDPRLKYFFKENEERAVARNFGIAKSVGQYITFLDSDDMVYSNHFSEAINLIEEYRSPEIFHLGYEIKDQQGNLCFRSHFKSSLNNILLKGNAMSCMGVFVRRDIFKEYAFNTDRALIGSEDYELWMRLGSRYEIYYSNVPTGCMIQHDDRSVLDFNEERILKRKTLTLQYIYKDKYFQEKFSRKKNLIEAHLNLYISLHAIMAKEYLLAFKYYIYALRKDPTVIFTRKTLGIIKNGVFTNFTR